MLFLVAPAHAPVCAAVRLPVTSACICEAFAQPVVLLFVHAQYALS